MGCLKLFCAILIIANSLSFSYGQTKSKAAPSKASKASSGGTNLSPFGRPSAQTSQQCQTPPSPLNGRVNCHRTAQEVICTGECFLGYLYPDGTFTKDIKCGSDGILRPTATFPDCHTEQRHDTSYGSETDHTMTTHPPQQLISPNCHSPPSPTNGRVNCQELPTELICTGRCNAGYQFPDKKVKKVIKCGSTGVLKPTSTYPDCEPLCDPPCQNGGTCAAKDKCLCRKNFWGSSCETSTSVCNLRAKHRVGYDCNIKNDVMTCTLYCGEGEQFEFQPAAEYHCTPFGVWNPSDIPNCVQIKQQPERHEMGSHTEQTESHGIKSHTEAPPVSPNCRPPPSPMNGKIRCKRSPTQLTCTGTCSNGYQFHDKSLEKIITCDSTGISMPSSLFPDCEPVCEPSCQNGGSCVAKDKCFCQKDFWGKSCEISTSVCDLRATHRVGYECNVKDDVMTCTLYCGQGEEFEFQPEAEYHCTPSGVWSPADIPNCVQIEQPPGYGSHTEQTESHESKSHTEDQPISPNCKPPPSPMSGKLSCKQSSTLLTCTATCFDGYQFHDKSLEKIITCDSTGILMPNSAFPNCEPTCEPSCQNGGTCVAKDTCFCEKDFWGKSCETSTSICDLRATHRVGYECNIKNDVMTCTLYCGAGMNFEFPPAAEYHCTPSGVWSPAKIPNCVHGEQPPMRYETDHDTSTDQTGSHGSQSEIGPQPISSNCHPPPPPTSGRLRCSKSSTELTCTGTCSDGYQFNDKSAEKIISCDSTGILTPSDTFPDCEPICEPSCQNGGTCVAKDTCFCQKDFWGKSCEASISSCNLQKTHKVGYECNIKNNDMTCKLSCPRGTKFEFQPANEYHCTPAGIWSPADIPNCIPEYEVSPVGPGSPTGHGPNPTSGPPSEPISPHCKVPVSPVNGRLQCSRSSTKLECTGTCFPGYQFFDKAPQKIITCDSTGVLKPTAKFPDCKPFCDPPCENGGSCVAKDRCMCQKDYWGKLCEAHVSICDLQATHRVGYQCKTRNDVMSCTLSCGKNMKFEFPPEPEYRCTPSGVWSPANIPNCVPSYEPVQPPESIKESSQTTEKPISHGSSESCQVPPAPNNGRVSCRRTSTTLTCTGECVKGYQFPDKSYTKRITCDGTGILKPTSTFPDCEPICDPSCENGGTCVGKDNCLCKKDYWGKQCESPVSVCDLQSTHTVGYECSIQQEKMACTLSCGKGMKFEFPPQSVYYCNPAGKWTPAEIPNCVLNDITSHGHEYNTNIGPKNTSKTTKEPVINIIDESFTTPGPFDYKTISKLSGRCVSWEKKHFQSFDGRMFSFEGSCSYLLVKDCVDSTFSIYINTNNEECKNPPCPISLSLFIETNEFLLKNVNGEPSLMLQDIPLAIPMSIHNINVQYISHYIAVSSDLGFRLLWDGQNLVQIDALSQSRNHTCGLCGRYDDNPLNDMETFEGILTDNVITFANSWKNYAYKDQCEDTNYVKDTCDNLSVDVVREAKRHCRRIRNKQYEDCLYLLDPTAYIEACISEYCTCHKNNEENCGCTSMQVFFKECGRVLGKQSYEWRGNNFCNITCLNGMTYQDCGSDCPATCSNPKQQCKSDWCNDGCFCEHGTLLGPNNQCFVPTDCPCLYQKKYYSSGEIVQQDCNPCKCANGEWQCTKEVCEARCSAVGDPHYTTFDGKHYDFMGTCSYYLISNLNYTIEQEFLTCDEPAAEMKGSSPLDNVLKPSCTKTITIRTKGSELHLKQDYSMVLNGQELTELPQFASGMYIYRPTSSFVKIELMNGLTVQWDGESRLYVDAPPTLLNTLQGLCGTFTQTQKDDFLTPEGDVENSVASFANKWKTDDFCEDVKPEKLELDPCSVHPQLTDAASSLCSLMHSDLFTDCYDVVDPEPYIRNCIYDMCSCKNDEEHCFCSSVANYAAICAKKGAIIEWRPKIKQCEIKCPSGQVYKQCSSSCTRSCKDIATNTKCTDQCVEGCNCPLGMTLNSENECVSLSECTCLFNDKEFPGGHTTVREGKFCTCINAVWQCRIATVEELNEAKESEEKVSVCSDAKNMEQTDCEVECPLTCSNFHKPPICQTVHCKPGCKCKEGFIFDAKAKTCIEPSECPCHHNGRTYKPGETMLQDCNICLCESARWKCEKRECSGICSTWGSSHVKTFDGRLYEFVGECDYTLAQGSLNSKTQFTINVQTMPCGDTEVTCYTSTTFIIGDEQLRLSKNEPIPELDSKSRFIIHKVGLYIVIHTSIGVTLYWDHGTRVYVKLRSQWKDGVSGLCGDFNNNEMDDFKSPLGGPTLAQPNDFADSWKVHSYCPKATNIEDQCKINPQRLAWAEKKCSILKSQLFDDCHSDVPVDPYLEKCISDTCGCDIGNDCECTCTAIATYAQECSIIGKPIEWRSQDLCPIQCRECDKYTPCMSVCPKTTCETEFLYKELDTTCKDEMCVEGCDPPACKDDEIFEDDKQFKCIPKNECNWQPCSVINGVRYHEGERITDETVALPCQSCHCLNGSVNCVGEPCDFRAQVTTTTTTTPKIQYCNNISRWSEWINSYEPTYDNGGDYEIVKDLVKGPYDLCPLEFITAIECRDAKTHKLATASDDNLHCTVSTGLMCENSLQSPDPICRDYEIRLFCDCEKTIPTTTVSVLTTPPPVQCSVSGWSEWMVTSDGKADKSSLRKQFSFCHNTDIIDVECREVITKKSSFDYEDLTCTTQNGFECNLKESFCPKFETRFNCHCEKIECNAKLGMEDGSINDNQITGSSYLHENVDGKGARLNGRVSWSPEVITNREWIQVEMPDITEITGIITQGSPTSKEWVTHFEVSYSDDGNTWKTIEQDDKPKVFIANIDSTNLKVITFPEPIYAKFIKILPTDWIHRISLRFELLGCNIEIPISTIPSVTFAPECLKTGWTDWISTDTPNTQTEYELMANEFGDIETISDLRYIQTICAIPTAIRCQSVDKKIPSHETGQEVTCDLNEGFKCLNSAQTDGKCLDYEISFYCDCRVTTPYATIPPVPPVPPVPPAPPAPPVPPSCPTERKGFTLWMNVGNPVTDIKGDIETRDDLRSIYEFCKDEYIEDIECRTATTHLNFIDSGQTNLICDLDTGFQCLHSEQPNYNFCVDYEVRFYCSCLDDVITTTEGVTKPEKVLAESATTTVVPETTGLLCAEWTGWINLSPGHAEVEEELLAEFPDFYKTCPVPMEIHCRQAHTEIDYTDFPHLKLDPACTLEGIRCDNVINDYKCPDFEINVLCECYPPKTTPIPSVVKIPPKCNPGWTQWYNIDTPESAGGDFERLEDLRTHYEFCSDQEIVDIKCAPADTSIEDGSGNLDFRNQILPDKDVKCSKDFGLECYNSLQTMGICHDYRIAFECLCELEREFPPTTASTTPYFIGPTLPPICNKWTEWYDSDSPDEDGIEIEFFETIKNFNEICPIVDRVQCNDSFTERAYYLDYPVSKLDEPCTSKGIKCTGEDCPDFRIRAFCRCEGVTEAPPVCIDGWTEWFNIDDPYSGRKDLEDLTTIKEKHEFCESHQIVDVECKTANNSIDIKETGDYAVKCNTKVGAACYSEFQPDGHPCHDYKVRFKCFCGEETTTQPPQIIESPCDDGYEWRECAYDCEDVCHSFLVQAHRTGECSINPNYEESSCIPACIKSECKSPKVWRDKNTCVMRSECNCLMEDGKMLGPGEVVEISQCERCQCLNNSLNCYTESGCGLTAVPQLTPGPPIPIVQEDCWTSWINDYEADKNGDSESLTDIRMKYEFCENPIKIECRIAETYVYVQEANEGATCDLKKGLQCKNNVGVKTKDSKLCSDYEVRFYCPCENYTTTPRFTLPTTAPEVVIGPCVQGFTDWFNAHRPDEDGEHEQLAEIRESGNVFCSNEHLTSIQCRETRTQLFHYQSSNRHLICDLQQGFYCNTEDQPEGEYCDDFSVRYFCDCPTTQPPSTVSTTQLTTTPTTTPLLITPTTTPSSTTTIPPPTTSSTTTPPLIQTTTPTPSTTSPTTRPPLIQTTTPTPSTTPPTTRPPLIQTTTPTPSTTPTTPTTTSPSTTRPPRIRITTTLPPSCNYWSRWINDDNPTYGGGDIEKITAAFIRRQEGFCSEGEITNIECVDSKTGRSYTQTGDEILACTMELGLTCINADQPSKMCKDYKIRYYCSCANYTTQIPITTTIIIVSTIKPVTVAPCTEFDSILDTVPDENFKASNSFTPMTRPEYARIDSESAWSPMYSTKDQYLEIDLGINQPVYGFVVRGHPKEQKWVTIYRIMYSRDGVSFEYYTKPNMKTPHNFPGPRISSDEEIAMLETPFEARYIRFIPQAWRNQIAMQVDILGCGKISTTTVLPSTTVRECDEPMGFENGQLTDDQIKVSSYKDPSYGASSIRINSGEGWVAEKSDKNQFVQVDFKQPRIITGIETQGRHGTDQYVSSYTVQYSTDGKTWYHILDQKGMPAVFNGNYDSDTPHVNYFYQPVRTTFIQIKPVTWNNWISMRLEIKGCFEPYPTPPEKIAEITATVPTITTTIHIHEPEYGQVTTESGELPELKCNVPMGLENGQISDSQITLSSSWHGESSGASRIRLNTPEDTETGGWLAYPSDMNQFVIIDFLEPISLSAIITQGRPVHDEWVEAYTVSYSLDGQTWESALKDGKQKFTGNTDGNTPNTEFFDDVIIARYLKIVPISWHNWISLRLEVLGCAVPVTATAVITGGECEEYGNWININKPYISDGDYETIDEIIKYSNFCTNPIDIECRDSITKIDSRATGQKVKCDLMNGLSCKNSEQENGKYCYDYEVRITCYTCPSTTVAEYRGGIVVCPEVPITMAKNCPQYCPTGQLCDGSKCISALDCPCYLDGKKFKPGDRLQTVDCQECECEVDGYTTCRNKTCPSCAAGLKERLGSDCKCYCDPCPPDTIMCEHSKLCIPNEDWCDGVIDCPNKEDEIACTTTSTTARVCESPPTCNPGTELVIVNDNLDCPVYECEIIEEATTTLKPKIPIKVTCNIYGNYFKTFDGQEYPYDICDHILMRDKMDEKFAVTIHKECDENSICGKKYLLIKQDQHQIRIDADLTVEYNYQIFTPSQLSKLSQTIQDFSIRVVANSMMFKSNIYEFEVEWNTQQNVIIKVGKSLLSKINGMCGFYNEYPADDYETPSGSLSVSSESFGNSWAIGPLERCVVQVCKAPIKVKAVDICNYLTLPPLDVCDEIIDVNFFMSACVSSVCDCLTEGKKPKECECDAYLTYVEACKKVEPTVKLNEWRTKLGCSPSCPPGLVWKDCGPTCERSCDNLQEDLSDCDDSCIAGCYCPDGTVKKRNNTCVTLDKCQDCVCDGYGDPHYNTFDRQYYPFQGNCTYVLARDKSPTGDHKFQVYITNDECLEEPGTTCTTAIMLLYKDHIVHFRVNHSVMVDGMVLFPEDFPMVFDGINITTTSAPDRTIMFKVDEISLEVRYFENNYGFQVRLPSDIYYNQTEGLCGNCNYDKSDDIAMKDGVITNDTREFGLSWLAQPPDQMQVVDSNCVIFEEKPCENLLEKERCEMLFGPQFKACHLLVDPESVLQSCQFDVCHSTKPDESLCRSLAEYSRACAQVGVCINWRSENLCPIHCAEGMYYDQCGPGCMKTCKNLDEHKEISEHCDADTVEGCFCIGDRVLKDGKCVDPMECEKCDDQGHGIGDTWKLNSCTNCECTEDLMIECTKTECPPKPICKEDEVLFAYNLKNDSCCEMENCFPKPQVVCPEINIPTCEPGEVSKAIRGSDSCPEYVCECDLTQCPPIMEPTLSEIGQVVIVDNSTCCAVKRLICDTSKCQPEPKCLPGEQLEIYNENKCCPDKNCVPPKDQCYYSHIHNKVSSNAAVVYNDREALYKPGVSWNDGLCTKCACDGSPGHYNAQCQKEVCPELDPEIKKNYIIDELTETGKCCPKIKQILCRLNGNKFEIGESLPSPDGNKCKKIECIEAPNGDAMKATITISCTLDCPKGFEYQPPLSTSKQCCGHCKPIACVEMNEIYEVGAKWTSVLNKCAMAHCINDSKVGVITQYETNCPKLPANCPEDKIIRDTDDCCDICSVVPPEDCSVQEMNLTETIKIFEVFHLGNECSNNYPIAGLTKCGGKCESNSIYSSARKDFESTCFCCKHDQAEPKTIDLSCSDGSNVPFTYLQPITCTCNLCSQVEYSVPPVVPAIVH